MNWKHLLIILTTFSSQLHWSILYDWCLLVHITRIFSPLLYQLSYPGHFLHILRISLFIANKGVRRRFGVLYQLSDTSHFLHISLIVNSGFEPVEDFESSALLTELYPPLYFWHIIFLSFHRCLLCQMQIRTKGYSKVRFVEDPRNGISGLAWISLLKFQYSRQYSVLFNWNDEQRGFLAQGCESGYDR